MPLTLAPGAVGANDIMIGTININYGNAGWAEKYYLPIYPAGVPSLSNYTAASVMLLNICLARCWLLGAGCSIVWARVSSDKVKHDSVAGLGGPLGAQFIDAEVGAGPTEFINQPSDGLLFRLENGAGNFSQRILTGVRDSWITDTQIGATIWANHFGAGTVNGTYSTPGALTKLAAMNNFICALQEFTVQAKKNAITGLWTAYPNLNVIFRYAGNRKRGRPTGMSRGRAPSRA